MKRIINSLIILIITIGVSGCMFFNEVDKDFEEIKKDAQKTLEQKYGQKFAELELISTNRGPIPGTSFDVVFNTYPISNKDQKIEVYASSTDGTKISDTYYWYLIENEYLDLLNDTIENILISSNTEYFYYVVNDERKKYRDDVSGGTTLEEALEKQLIKTKLYVYVYRNDLEEEEFIRIGDNLVEALRGGDFATSLTLRSAMNSESYQFLVDNAKVNANGLSPYLYMSYTFGNTVDQTKEYRFRYVNKLENKLN